MIDYDPFCVRRQCGNHPNLPRSARSHDALADPDGYGNASSIYKKGREARIAMEDARHKVEKALGIPRPGLTIR